MVINLLLYYLQYIYIFLLLKSFYVYFKNDSSPFSRS